MLARTAKSSTPHVPSSRGHRTRDVPPALAIALPPADGVYRVGRQDQHPFDPPFWARTGGGRFDDPRERPAGDTPEPGRFRVVYCASDRAVAFREVLARFRPSVPVLMNLRSTPADDEDPHLRIDLADGVDFHEGEARGIVHREWRWLRHAGHLLFPDPPRCANLAEPDSWTHLLSVPGIQDIAHAHGVVDGIDLSTVMSQHRALTQACAGYIYGLRDGYGTPRFAGIKYRSRFGSERQWECWAFFDDRLSRLQASNGRPIRHDDPDLISTARLFNLAIVDDDGNYIRH